MRHREHRSIRALTLAGAIVLAVVGARAQSQSARPARIDGRPNLNGIWQALNTAYWNLESHSAEALNEEFGLAVGADAYCRDAAIAAETARTLVEQRRNAVHA